MNILLEAVGSAQPNNPTFELIWGIIAIAAISAIVVIVGLIILKNHKE